MPHLLAYCTNVHAGGDLARVWGNLERYCLAVKARFAPDRPMGVGLWLPAPTAKKLLEPGRLAGFADWLASRELIPFTLNGFPYGDFHESQVKHRVYHPTSFDSDRLEYTRDLARILHAILPETISGSISTLPIAWGTPAPSSEQLAMAARQLIQMANHLAELEEESGRLITLCLEPEPGCVLQCGGDIVWFFDEYLGTGEHAERCQRYIRVCHDICHAAVMFEDQQAVLEQYSQRGISVGKVQVSSAIEADFDLAEASERAAILDALTPFAESRYLHQTTIRSHADAPLRFFDDLPAALTVAQQDTYHVHGQWRVHFHVPVYLKQLGRLATTQTEIRQCLHAIERQSEPPHFEVETYAWGVLPPALQCAEVADGIAREMSWLQDLLGG
ncbi:MAG: metabolite traffic protein EboE [Pirellulaceae bacterium]